MKLHILVLVGGRRGRVASFAPLDPLLTKETLTLLVLVSVFISVKLSAEMYVIRNNTDGMHYCNLCNYSARLRPDVTRHIESRHLALEYTCRFCNSNKVFKTKRSYQNHLRNYHKDRVDAARIKR